MKTSLFQLLILVLFSSCATVKFYDDSALKNESGIEFYSAKPYLLVERQPAKDVAIKSTVIYLPDRANPKYAKLKPGFGSSDLKLSLENGMITSYGVITDSKIPETITAITGAVGTAGTTYQAIADAIKSSKSDDVSNAFNEVLEDNTNLKKAKAIIDNVIKDFELIKGSDLFTENQRAIFNSLLAQLKIQDFTIDRPTFFQIQHLVTELDKIIKGLNAIEVEAESDDGKKLKGRLKNNIKELTKARLLLKAKEKAPVSTFELYEIVITQEGTTLKRVE